MKSFEERLYSAWAGGRGMTLSYGDAVSLLGDDAIATRVTDQARVESGLEPAGRDGLGGLPAKRWLAFRKRVLNATS
jgi:hypothetical protein